MIEVYNYRLNNILCHIHLSNFPFVTFLYVTHISSNLQLLHVHTFAQKLLDICQCESFVSVSKFCFHLILYYFHCLILQLYRGECVRTGGLVINDLV